MKAFRLRRFRLTLAACGVFGSILAVLFIAGIYLIRQEEIGFLSRYLKRAAASSFAEFQEKPSAPEVNEVLESFPNVSVVFYNKKDQVIAHSGKSLSLLPGSQNGLQQVQGQWVVAYNSGQQPLGRIVVSTPWVDRQNFINRVAWFFALIFIPIVAFGGGATYLAAKRTFTPLDEMTRQAELLTEKTNGGKLVVSGNDEFSLFADRLNGFIERIRAAAVAQEQFVADAAHELRTPLTVMRGEIEITLMKNREPDEYQKAMKAVLEESERLSRLVELLLLSATKIEEKAPALSLEEACMHAESKWVDRYTQHGINLTVETQEIWGSILPEEIESVLDNLLSNALRYAPASTSVILKLRVSKGLAIIDCIDQGPGVPLEYQEKIFERFARVDKGRNRDMGGFGIGLAVCRRLIEARDGSIRCLSVTTGAHFQVSLPVSEDTV